MSSENTTNIIPNSYIVVFHSQTTPHTCESHCSWAQQLQQSRISALSSDDDCSSPPGIKHHYKLSEHDGWLGYAGRFDAATAREIEAKDEVAYVEPDHKVYTKDFVTQSDASWGLVRVSQREKITTGSVSSVYTFDKSAGEGVTAYVIDTGVFAEHEDFEGRAELGFNAVDGSANTDKNGHGTHVGATIGGKTYGVAKKTKIIGIKVLGDDGSGSTSSVIAGVDWAVKHAADNSSTTTSVVNMSLGGSFSRALNSAVKAAVTQGMTVCVAAGNERQDASTSSPASEPAAITVGATTVEDTMSSFSNWGTSVDIFGPGTNITSAWIDESGNDRKTLTKTISGTSMATPHITGLAAYLIALEGLDAPAKVRAKLMQFANKGLISGLRGNSPNLLAYNGADSGSEKEL